MKTRSVALLALAVGLVAARPWKPKEEPPPPPPEPAPAPPAPPPQWTEPLFPAKLPFDPGPLAKGLADVSAQSCNACHWEAHDGWASSAHAKGHEDPSFRRAVAAAATPACQGCHQPLVNQHAERVEFDAGDPNRPLATPNPTWDATLGSEGVTCVACHLRDGQILSPRAPSGPAPHPILLAPVLKESAACATCHQLVWPGADLPFYDTVGEWSRSPHAAAGLQCQDCHMAPAPGRTAVPDHGLDGAFGRGLTLRVQPSSARLVRGAEPISVELRLQNTGAGHSLPTGSPYGGLRLVARTVRLADNGLWEPHGSPFVADIQRTIEPTAPYKTTADNRLAPGEVRTFLWSASLDAKAPTGSWAVEVSLGRTTLGSPKGAPFLTQRVPLRVE